MPGLVVCGDGNVDELGGGVSVAKGNDGDVDVRSLLDGLGVGPGVGNDDQAGLLERASDVVGEVTGGETTSDGGGTGVGGVLQDSALTVGTGRDSADIGGVVDGSDDASSKDDLLPEIETPYQLSCSPSRAFPNSSRISNSTNQVLPMLMMFTPSGLVFQR